MLYKKHIKIIFIVLITLLFGSLLIFHINRFKCNLITNITAKNRNIDIQQWALSNNGTFNYFLNDANSWFMDNTKAIENVDINATKTDTIFMNNRSVIVAVIDSDIYYLHKAFSNKIWINEFEVPNDNIDNDNNGYIDDVNGWNFCDNNATIYNTKAKNVHGTHIVGIICGEDKNLGYSSLLKYSNEHIMCLKSLSGEDASGKISSIIKAIQYAENNGAKICCLSLDSYIKDTELENVIQNSNMLFIVACGNDGVELNDSFAVYPASFKLKNVISVADIRCDGNISHISNYSKEYVDVAAPGTDIVSTFPNDTYGYLSGTSCATAYVAAEAALIYQHASDEINATEIKNIICQNVTFQESLKEKVKSGGYINVLEALINTP